MDRARLLGLGGLLICLTCGAAAAPVTYQLQSIAKGGDKVGSTQIRQDASYMIGALNDRGQLLFTADGAAGGQLLLQSADHQITAVAGAGGNAPQGQWPQSVFFFAPLSMNQLGQAAFAAPAAVGNQSYVGTFRMDYPSRQISMLVRDGMPAGNGLTFGEGGAPGAVINNRGEISFVAAVKNAAGVPVGHGVFFVGADGRLQTIALPGQIMPDGAKVVTPYGPSLNDAGTVAFIATGANDPTSTDAPSAGRRAYLWQNGTITPLPADRVTAPPGVLMLGFIGVWANNQNQNILLAAHLHSLAGHLFGLYQIIDGVPKSVAMPGQVMPGGGKLLTLQESAVSAPNELGQHAFLALLEDGTTAAYRLDADGKLALLLRSGATSTLGKIANVGQGSRFSHGIGLNKQSEVGLTVRLATGTVLVALLTPAAP